MQWSAQTKSYVLWSAVALGLALLLYVLGPVLTPFIVAAVFAYALAPLVDKLVAKRLPRPVAAGLAIATAMLITVSVLMLIIPIVTQQIPLLREQIPALFDRLNTHIAPLLARLGVDFHIDVKVVRDGLRTLLAGKETEVVGGIWTTVQIGGSALLALLGNLVLMPLVAFYLLLDWDRLVQRLKAMVPRRWLMQVNDFLKETDAVLGQYLRGQLLVMLVLAAFYSVALALTGLDLALPIGAFTGLAVFVPYLGFGLGCVLAIVAALLQFDSLIGVLAVVAVYGVGQLLESFYLTPKLLGERIGLHPIAVIFALLAFGHLLGFVGVLIALPASAVLLVALRRLKGQYLDSHLYKDDPDQTTPAILNPDEVGLLPAPQSASDDASQGMDTSKHGS